MKRLILAFGVLALTVFGLNYAETEAKTLQVQANSHAGILPSNGVRIPLLQINLRAADEPVTVKSVTLSRSGLSSNEDIDRLWLQQEYVRLSRSRSFPNEDILTLNFTRDFIVEANTTERIYVLANLSFERGNGRTIKINLEDIETDALINAPQSQFQHSQTNTQQITTPTPVVSTRSKAPYDRSKYRIKCRNSRCSLIKRY